jgi:hypothetical protein
MAIVEHGTIWKAGFFALRNCGTFLHSIGQQQPSAPSSSILFGTVRADLLWSTPCVFYRESTFSGNIRTSSKITVW